MDQRKNVAIALVAGAMGGGLLAILATRAIPKMMAKMMAGMMQNMMANMREGGFNPPDS